MIELQPFIKECEGGAKAASVEMLDAMVCTIYALPEAQWRRGSCPMAAHIKRGTPEQAGKVRVGQQKQKKKVKKR